MAATNTECNGVLQILTGAGAVGLAGSLGMVSGNFTLANNATFPVPNAILTGCPVKVRINYTLSAGSVTLNASVNSNGTYASATGTSATSGTTEQTLMVETTASNPYVNLEFVAGSGGATISSLEVLVYGLCQPGHDNPVTLRNGFDCLQNNSVVGGIFTTTSSS